MITNGCYRTKDWNKFSVLDNTLDQKRSGGEEWEGGKGGGKEGEDQTLIFWRLRSPMLISKKLVRVFGPTGVLEKKPPLSSFTQDPLLLLLAI
uniref:Uncharacterized protein n=1 Tax=Vespula pensylvanica TaxID=30213 RepID=A0A834P702_VESPE|nr:hypothetical protein H0235_004302 [Vespula pensylvanica]